MDPKTASLLPPFIFHCQLPSGGAELAAEPESKPQPAPWEVCESFGPARCKRNDDRCSLCTENASGLELCFRPSVAAKLPPCERAGRAPSPRSALLVCPHSPPSLLQSFSTAPR